MIPELGLFAIILALCFSLLLMMPIIFRSTDKAHFMRVSGITYALGQFIFLSTAMLFLILSFLNNDLTVIYVREHSHHLLPLIYKIGAAWGGHEGSLLLWCLILSGWTLAFVTFNQFFLKQYDKFYDYVVMTLGIISSGFILFLLMTSNPFQRSFPLAPIVGNDLVPVLQDPGLIFHPPMLYMGYVGFAVGFAFAIAALLTKQFDKKWAAICRPWIILPWSFLSCGIVLGSWWAYRELGWGGWWFWDPVENASLLPWLSATALLHCLIVCEKRDTFKGWAILLAIVTFSLSLIGTFLVRSGVLVSVHAFASDPSRGIFLLAYLTFIIGGALLLYSLRIHKLYRAPNFQLFSRETFLLINSVVLLTLVATILLGTLYPILLDAIGAEKISVGEPYFNIIFVPIILPLLILMGVAPHMHWGQQSLHKLWHKLKFTLLPSLVLSFLAVWIWGFTFYWLTWIGLSIGLWLILSTLVYVIKLEKIELKHAPMIIAHLGIAILALGVTFNKTYSEERQVKMAIGETVNLAGYDFTFKNLTELQGPNFKSLHAEFFVNKPNGFFDSFSAEQRLFTHDQLLSKTGIVANPWRDLYLALGNALPDGSWSVRIYYKPLVRWIWFGGFLLLMAGFLSLLNYLTSSRALCAGPSSFLGPADKPRDDGN